MNWTGNDMWVGLALVVGMALGKILDYLANRRRNVLGYRRYDQDFIAQQVSAIVADLRKEVATLRHENRVLRRQVDRLTNQLQLRAIIPHEEDAHDFDTDPHPDQ